MFPWIAASFPRPQKLWTRDFTIITLGSVVSMLGNAMSDFALNLLVLDYTGSNLLYAIYIETLTLPQIIMPIFSGAILDRFSRKRTIYTLDFISAGVYLTAALIPGRGWFSFPLLAAFCFIIIGPIDSITMSPTRASIPCCFSEGNYSKAYSIASVLTTLSMLSMVAAAFFYRLVGIAPRSAPTRCSFSSPRRRRRRHCPLPVMMLSCFLNGILGVTSYTIRISATQSYMPDEKKGRFSGTFNMLFTVGSFSGNLPADALTAFLPPRLVLTGFLLVTAAAAAAVAVIGGGREAVSAIYNRQQ